MIKSEEKLEQMALIDNLTGLYNRHYLLAFLDHIETNAPEERWLAILDIDDFKKVNDTYGHNCGDMILHQVADIVKLTCRNCIVCRWGGEEFIILSNKRECSPDVLETLRQTIAEEEFKFENESIHITVTIGVAQFDGEPTNDGWISKADERLYHGKKNGKNSFKLTMKFEAARDELAQFVTGDANATYEGLTKAVEMLKRCLITEKTGEAWWF